MTQDLKAVLLVVLQQGLIDAGYGVRSIETVTPSSTDNPNTLTIKRSGAQDEDNRPLLTVRRIAGPTPVSFYMSNYGFYEDMQSAYVPVIQVQDRVRIQVEASQDTGGQSLIDKLMLQIPQMLLQNWDAMTFPWEAGGYGLYNLTFRGSDDVIRAFIEAGGKAIYSNAFDVSATYTLDTPSQTPAVSTITAIEFVPIVVGNIVLI